MERTRLLELVDELQRADDQGESRATQLCSACLELLGVHSAGIVLIGDGEHPVTLATSDDVTSRLEELQFMLGEGPGLDAHRDRRPVSAPELAQVGGRWPTFSAFAVEQGIRAAFAFPLEVGAIRIGSLDLFHDRPGPLPDEGYADALVMADVITQTALGLQALAPEGVLAAEFDDAQELRAPVHQAAGMISAQLDIGIADALVRLRAHAYATKHPIDVVARQVVDRTLRLD